MGLDFGNTLFPQNFEFSDEGKGLVETSGEEAGRNKTLILKRGAVSSGTDVTVYTVTTGKTLFITSAWLVGRTNGVSGSFAGILKATVGGNADQSILEVMFGNMDTSAGSEASGNNALSFPTPIRVESGDLVELTAVTTAVVIGGFAGWEE